jgi:hypothetical protein
LEQLKEYKLNAKLVQQFGRFREILSSICFAPYLKERGGEREGVLEGLTANIMSAEVRDRPSRQDLAEAP